MNALALDVPLSPPTRGAMLRETRAVLDLLRMAPALLRPSCRLAAERTRRILVLPGFGADDRATWPLRRYLARRGHRVEGWGLGRNLAGLDIPHRLEDVSAGWRFAPRATYRGEAGVPLLCDRVVARVRERSRQHGEPLVLIGWSLGGTIAREVARELPEAVARVVTLGSPVRGGPKYTAAARLFRERGMDLDWIEREVEKREATPIRVPVTAIVSPSDGVVGLGAAIDRRNPRVEHVALDAAHLGLCVNPDVWAQLDRILAERPV